MGLPKEAPEETEPVQVQGHVRKRLECLSPTNSKRPRTCLAESGQIMSAGTNQRGNPAGSCCSVEKDAAGRDEEDPEPPPEISSSVRVGADPPDAYLPPGWTHIKLEPDW